MKLLPTFLIVVVFFGHIFPSLCKSYSDLPSYGAPPLDELRRGRLPLAEGQGSGRRRRNSRRSRRRNPGFDNPPVRTNRAPSTVLWVGRHRGAALGAAYLKVDLPGR